jgi:hypothetical protein
MISLSQQLNTLMELLVLDLCSARKDSTNNCLVEAVNDYTKMHLRQGICCLAIINAHARILGFGGIKPKWKINNGLYVRHKGCYKLDTKLLRSQMQKIVSTHLNWSVTKSIVLLRPVGTQGLVPQMLNGIKICTFRWSIFWGTQIKMNLNSFVS